MAALYNTAVLSFIITSTGMLVFWDILNFGNINSATSHVFGFFDALLMFLEKSEVIFPSFFCNKMRLVVVIEI